MSWRSWARLLPLLLAFLPAACGSLPRPFEGRPGTTALRLAQPPPARLAVAPPGAAWLGDAAAAQYAAAVAEAMQEQALPAVAGAANRGDWRLELTAELRDGMVMPGFRVIDPAGDDRGSTASAPVSAATWAAAAPETLQRAGRQAAPAIAALLTDIEAARREADPDSLVNRPVRLRLGAVSGAPGDGNRALARHMRDELGKLGLAVQDMPEGADYTLVGDVTVANVPGNQQRVEIRWKVADARGAEAGQVVQLNQVPRGLLDGLWADVALVVAQEAAGGVRDVIRNQTGVPRAAAPP